MRLREFDEKERLLKANEKLTKYKTDAGADAAAADAAGNFARGHKRFKGINAATKKQFANDAKLAKLKEFAEQGVAEALDSNFVGFMNKTLGQKADAPTDKSPMPDFMKGAPVAGLDSMGYKAALDFGMKTLRKLTPTQKTKLSIKGEDGVVNWLANQAKKQGLLITDESDEDTQGKFMQEDLDEVQDFLPEVFHDPAIKSWAFVLTDGEPLPKAPVAGPFKVGINPGITGQNGYANADWKTVDTLENLPDARDLAQGLSQKNPKQFVAIWAANGKSAGFYWPGEGWRGIDEGVTEGNEWQGNRGNSQAGITDHTFDEAKQYIKGNYPFHKTYNVSRVEPGMRYHANPEKVANKTQSLVKGIDSALDYLQVKQNPMMSGSTQVTPSIGYSWHTHESRANGIAVLYYEDRGMGNDAITIAAKDQNNLKGAVQVCRDAGVIPLPKVKDQGVAEGSLEEVDRRGFLKGLGAAAVAGAAGGANALGYDNNKSHFPAGGMTAETPEFMAMWDAMTLYYYCQAGKIKNCNTYFSNLKSTFEKIKRLKGGLQRLNWLYQQIKNIDETQGPAGLVEKGDIEKFASNYQKIIKDLNSLVEFNESVNQGVAEEWSQKYKNSINCSHPKGFSQKAHCAGKQKHNESIEMEMVCEDCGMCQSHGSLNEIKKGEKDSNGYTRCWPGKHAEGTKTGKNGGQVRNCEPNESVEEEAKHGLYYNVNKRKAAGTSRPASSPKAPTAQAWKDAAKTAKNESVAEDQLDELSKDTLKNYVRAQPSRIKGPAGLATTDNKKAARIVDRDIPRALDKYKDPEYGHQQRRLPEDSLAAMRRLAGVTTPLPAAVPNGPRQYRHMPTAVQPR